jgi:hypothetical protein
VPKFPSGRLTLDEQIAYVQRWGESSAFQKVGALSGLVAAVAVGYFVWSDGDTQKVIALFISGMSGMLCLALLFIQPRLRVAAHAIKSGRRVETVLQLVVDTDSDSPSYSGTLKTPEGVWTLRFLNPFGWTPADGALPCQAVFLADVPAPVLVVANEGLLLVSKPSGR